MFAKSKFSCNFSRCFCFYLWSERLAGEDGCNSGYCFGASESFVSKISVFSNMRFRWFIMSWSGSVQVYNRFTSDFWGYCVRFFLLKTGEVKILLIIPDHIFCPASKKPIAFNYSSVWSSLIICSRLTNARDSLKFNIHSGKLRMPVTCFWIYWFIDYSILF